jgi:hypothetical protein
LPTTLIAGWAIVHQRAAAERNPDQRSVELGAGVVRLALADKEAQPVPGQGRRSPALANCSSPPLIATES